MAETVVDTLEVIDIKFDVFNGHVYDLETKSSLYVANGLITSNCQCSETFETIDDDAEEDSSGAA